MEIQLKFTLLCAAVVFLTSSAGCNASANGTTPVNWTCTCAGGLQGAAPEPNCTASCNCRFAGDAGWHCSCGAADKSCFSSCDCSSGGVPSQNVATSDPGKAILIVLLVFVVIAAAAFVGFAVYFFGRKDKILPSTSSSSSRIHSDDRYSSSCNSRLNLIKTRSYNSSDSQHRQGKISSTIGTFREFIRWLSALSESNAGLVPGAIVRFSYAELEQATDRFSEKNMIGVGGSCRVYRGQLADGKVVAIKKHRPHGGAEADYEFLSEIELLARLNHFHVVPLLGYCSEHQGKTFERLLVFEYMSNGNLRDCLDMKGEKQALDWETRIKIAHGAARGLEYLHEAAAPRILHRDIKSTNILLDDKYRAKITDLGMAKRLSNDDAASCSNSPARMLGTFGYFAPEYAIVGKASLKSDVFSFGVVVLELITGRQPIVQSTNSYDESLVIWATPRLRDSKLVVTELPDPRLKGKFSQEEMQIMAHLARECLQWDPELRPTMSEIVQMLTTIAPNKPRRKLLNNFAMDFHRGAQRGVRADPEAHVSRREGLQALSERWNPRSPMVADRHHFFEGRRRSTEGPELSVGALRRKFEEMAVHLTEPRLEMFTPVSNPLNAANAASASFDLREPRLETFRQDTPLE